MQIPGAVGMSPTMSQEYHGGAYGAGDGRLPANDATWTGIRVRCVCNGIPQDETSPVSLDTSF